MIIRYSTVYDTLVLYYYNEDGKVVREALEFDEVRLAGYDSLSKARSFLTSSPYLKENIIHDDGEE